MSYFLGTDKIEKINVNNLDEIECVAQYNLLREYDLWIDSNITVKNHTIRTYNPYIDLNESLKSIEKFEIQKCDKKLPTEPDESLKFIEVFKNEDWENRIKLEVVENKYTLLSIRDEHNNYMKFDNDTKVLLLDYVFNNVEKKVEVNDNYLAIAIVDRCKSFYTKKHRQTYFILIKIIENDKKVKILTTVFSKRLGEKFPDLWFERIIFNTSLISTKLLLIMRERFVTSNPQNFLLTFDTINKTFSSPFKWPFKSFHCRYLFYCSNNILKDVLVIVNRNNMVYVLKESLEGCLYIHKETLIRLPDSCDTLCVYCCNNRNNEIILLIPVVLKEEDLDGELQEDLDEEGLEESFLYDILMYNVINDKIHRKFQNGSGDRIRSYVKIFFNRTGEEIFIADKDTLKVFVYKSKVHSLKRTCQLVVLRQYSSEHIDEMNLPKYILNND